MSAAHSQFSGHGLTGLRMRAEDYLAIGQTRERYELVNGVVVMSPSPRPRHWKVIQELVLQFSEHERRGGTADVYAETDLQLHEFAVFKPDICVYASRSDGGIPERLTLPPDLVIEVLSPGTEAFDLITKKDEYEQRGIREYWVIDPADARVRAWRIEHGRFVESIVSGDALPCHAIAGFALDLRRLAKVVSG